MKVVGRKPGKVNVGDTLVRQVLLPDFSVAERYDRISSIMLLDNRNRYVYTLAGMPGEAYYISMHTPMNILVEED